MRSIERILLVLITIGIAVVVAQTMVKPLLSEVTSMTNAIQTTISH